MYFKLTTEREKVNVEFKKNDNIILNWINVSLRNRFFDIIMSIITSIGNLGVVWIIISVLLLLLLLRENDYNL